ncbi:carboxylesterase family protein [Altererythrobacter salegens]|uniref:Carboxylic ester hydrolase n=1 Tax=Croceibacterium salegens TaxID=1737568 RepID=A0A6I4SZE2_9SPHN|nr:carboxylesterase family protein [Croceibacterium salegens]MXO61371.1 carboxylesterase family protein [Croceibacterium salegens]
MPARRWLAVAATLALAACNASQSPTEVATTEGIVAGSLEGGVLSWKGIPFAAPPVGDLRWRAPQPAKSWDGIRQATEYGSDCMQLPFPSDAAPLGTPPAEDCLYANVWKPEGATGKLPVIFWIYGGGFVNGGSSPPTYTGANLAKQGVMVVSANYRVGRFGTFAHPQLTAADPDGGLLGNYGYLDQIAALKWVKDNIAVFGGDPDNVTIVGESAGGMSVHFLVTSPLAKGLFAKAVVMSGGDGQGMGGNNLAGAEKIGVDFAKAKGIAEDDPDALGKLRALSADDVTDGLNLAALFAPLGAPRTFASPFADGKIAVDVAKAYADGKFDHVPMMIGATSDDIGGKTGSMIGGARSLSAAISRQGVPVYEYRFSYVAETLDPGNGAQHASDIPFFFDTQAIKYGDATTARDNAMGKAISTYLVNFAKSGDPNGGELPTWPAYSTAGDEIMDFATDGTAKAVKDPLGAEIDAAQAGAGG